MPTHCVDILIPSFDNPQFLGPCINSILGHTQSRENIRIIVINNGAKETENYVTKHPLVKFIHAGKNLGWEGGLKLGLEHSDTEFVCFMNDDTYIPYASSLWVNRCLSEFANPEVAAVGPTTNLCRGYQNIFLDQFAGYYAPYASLLIFFCVFLRRKDLDAVGGVDDTLPGGDDLDLCIRLTKAGKKLVICRDAFVFHHGFKTGERVKGGPDRPVGWNSREMTENTNKALIRKHGFRTFLDCNHGGLTNPEDRLQPSRKNEAAVVMKHIIGEKIYELGCGAAKTTPTAIGIDRVKLGDVIPNLEGAISVADIQADVTHELPIPDESADTIVTRHILEHCVDTIGTLRNWIKKIKPGKRLILTVPDETACLVELLGMKQVAMENGYNGVSFTSVFDKS